jgi:hypothetical protein
VSILLYLIIVAFIKNTFSKKGMEMFNKHNKLLKFCAYFLLLVLPLSFAYSETSGSCIEYISLKPAEFSGASLNEDSDSLQYKPEDDSSNVKFVGDSLKDTLTTVVQPDTSKIDIKEKLTKKSFIGTKKDITIGVSAILIWLAFMWLAANQGPD